MLFSCLLSTAWEQVHVLLRRAVDDALLCAVHLTKAFSVQPHEDAEAAIKCFGRFATRCQGFVEGCDIFFNSDSITLILVLRGLHTRDVHCEVLEHFLGSIDADSLRL